MSSRSTALNAEQRPAWQNPLLPPGRHCPPLGELGKVNSRIALFPIVFFEVYLTLTVLLFAFGPWPWHVSNPVTLYGFLALVQAALLAGYVTAIHKHPPPRSHKWCPSRLVVVSLLFNFAWLPELYNIRTSTVDFSFAAAASRIAAGISDPAAQYHQKIRDIAALGPSTLVGYLTFLVYPILWILVPVAVLYWHRLSTWTRIGFGLWFICDISTWVASGTNKGIADYAVLLPWLLIARRPALLANLNSRKVLMIAFVVLAGMGALFTFFSMNMIGRAGGQSVVQYDLPAGISMDADNMLIRFLPPAQQGSVAALVSYVTQGYYALSLALHEPFVFCYGVGNSYFLEGLTRKFVASPIMDRTYPARIETYGWSRYGRWHSLYTWIACDVSFYGVIIVVFLIGRLLAALWLDVVVNKDPLAISLFALLLMMLYYASANNQVLGFPSTAIPFWTLLCIWSRRRVRQFVVTPSKGVRRRAVGDGPGEFPGTSLVPERTAFVRAEGVFVLRRSTKRWQ